MKTNKLENKTNIFLISFSITIFISILVLLLTNNPSLMQLDNNITNWFFLNRIRFLDYFFVILSYLGETETIIFLCIILLCVRNRKKLGLPVSIITLASFVLNFAVKIIVARARPVGFFLNKPTLFYQMPSGYSFPSGHAMTANIFYLSLCYYLSKNLTKKKLIFLSSFTLIICLSMSISRIYLGVHYFSDVLAGISLMTALFSIFLLITKNKQALFEYL